MKVASAMTFHHFDAEASRDVLTQRTDTAPVRYTRMSHMANNTQHYPAWAA